MATCRGICLHVSSFRLWLPKPPLYRCYWRIASFPSEPARGRGRYASRQSKIPAVTTSTTDQQSVSTGKKRRPRSATVSVRSSVKEHSGAVESQVSPAAVKTSVGGKRARRKAKQQSGYSEETDSAEGGNIRTGEETHSASLDVAMATTQVENNGSKAKGPRIREVLGKKKVKYTPIEILPNSVESRPLTYIMGSKTVDHETISKMFDSKRRHNFTNENFIRDEVELNSDKFLWRNIERGIESLTSQVPPEVKDLVKYLVTEVGLSKADATLYLNSAPSLVGTSLTEVKELVKVLKGLGFTENQVGWILPCFPSALAVDWKNFRNVYLVFSEKLKIKERNIASLMKKYPFIFTLDHLKVSILLGEGM